MLYPLARLIPTIPGRAVLVFSLSTRSSGSRATYGRSTRTMRILSLRNSWRKHHARGDISLTNGATRLICPLGERCCFRGV